MDFFNLKRVFLENDKIRQFLTWTHGSNGFLDKKFDNYGVIQAVRWWSSGIAISVM